MKRFWNWARDPDDDPNAERTLYIQGAIADNDTWYEDDITPKAFVSELNAGKGPITIYLDSPGGDCFAAAKIYNALMEYPNSVTVKIGSMAASAASVIAMAGGTVLISPVGQILIHNPSSIAIGDSAEMRKAAQMLDAVKESIINAYELKSNQSRLKLARMMDEEKFMSAQEALSLGFVDGVLFEQNKPANDYAAVFNKIPDIGAITRAFKRQKDKPAAPATPPDTEQQKPKTGTPIESLEKRLSLISH